MLRVWKLFGRIEARVQSWFAHYPVLYALYGGIGIVLFWRGVWHGMDTLAIWYFGGGGGVTSIDLAPSVLDSLFSFVLGSAILLSCGLWVSSFLGNEVIISGLRGEKRLSARTETEVRTETGALADVLEELDTIHARLEELDKVRRRTKQRPAPPPLPPKNTARK